MTIELSDKCPECGYLDMVETDIETKEIPSGDRDVPPDYETIWLKEYCPECGFEQTKDNELDPDSLPGGHDYKKEHNL